MKIIIILISLLLPTITNADIGRVVLFELGCSHFIVETENGYSLLERYGLNTPHEGDILNGDFNGTGARLLNNPYTNEDIMAWSEGYQLSDILSIEKYYERCVYSEDSKDKNNNPKKLRKI